MTRPILKQFRTFKPFVKRNDYVPGWVYLQQASDGSVKVGLSRNVRERKRALEKDYGRLNQLAAVWVLNMKWLEDEMKERFKPLNFHKAPGLSGRTEWHRADDNQTLEMIGALYAGAFWVNVNYLFWFVLGCAFVYVVFL
jgi:hypothetical protein